MKEKTQHKLTIGLTGGIGCGKSAVLAAWQQLGAYTLDCDELVREITVRPAVQKQIAAAFGVTEKRALARKVFASCAARKQLEQLLHPLVHREMAKRLRAVSASVRVVEVPLLFEAGWEKDFDITVAVAAPEKQVQARVKQRGLTQTELAARQWAQWPQAQKMACADIAILNQGSITDLKNKISILHRALCKIYHIK